MKEELRLLQPLVNHRLRDARGQPFPENALLTGAVSVVPGMAALLRKLGALLAPARLRVMTAAPALQFEDGVVPGLTRRWSSGLLVRLDLVGCAGGRDAAKLYRDIQRLPVLLEPDLVLMSRGELLTVALDLQEIAAGNTTEGWRADLVHEAAQVYSGRMAPGEVLDVGVRLLELERTPSWERLALFCTLALGQPVAVDGLGEAFDKLGASWNPGALSHARLALGNVPVIGRLVEALGVQP